MSEKEAKHSPGARVHSLMGAAMTMSGLEIAGVRDRRIDATLPEPDAELMLRVKAGDMAGFSILVDRHRGHVIQFLFRMVVNRAVAEELAQEVFVRIFRARQSYEPSARFTTWMMRISTNLALNWLRDHKGERGGQSLDQEVVEGAVRQVADLRENVEQTMVRQARLSEVRVAVEALPEKQRAAVLMHKYQDMDYASIARTLECSEAALKSLLFRAYETLRSRLAHLGA